LQIVKTKQAQGGEIVCRESLDGQIVFLMDVHLQENLSQSYKVAARYVVQKSINKKREQEPECPWQ